DGLLHHSYLDTINVVVDADLNMVCCQICQIAVVPNHMPGHIKNKHPQIKLNSTQYCQAVVDMKVSPTLPSFIAGGPYYSHYKGLRGAQKQFWRVADTKEMFCDHQEVLDRMRKEMAEVTRIEQVPQDNRMVSPWLLSTNGINNTPLHRHQEATTMQSYIRSTVGLLAMLLRTDGGDDYEIPM
ncbi:hypothetical protein BDR07DRAFT_1224920, partial [Suillus spraguei]